MPRYVVLHELTQRGIESIEESPDRLDEAKDLLESMGCELVSFYLTFGRYDVVAVFDAPDDETAARFLLTLGKGGTARSETLKAFPEDEYRELVTELPE